MKDYAYLICFTPTLTVADIQLLINAPDPYVIAKENAPQAKSPYRQGWESDGWSSFLQLFEVVLFWIQTCLT